MATKKKKKKGEKTGLFSSLKKETRHSVIAIMLFVLVAFFILAAWGKSGIVGGFVFTIFDKSVGLGFFLVPLSLFLLGVSFLRESKPNLVLTKTVGALIFFFSGLGIVSLLVKNGSGGIVGAFVATPLVKLFDLYVTLLVLTAFLIISLLLIFDSTLKMSPISFSFFKRNKDVDEYSDKDENYGYDDNEEDADDGGEEDEEDEDDEEEDTEEKKMNILGFNKDSGTKEDGDFIRQTLAQTDIPYIPPPLKLLSGDRGKPGVGDIKANANIIKRTLANFGITVEMDEISVGPSVTRYALKPAQGVKLSRIVGLQNDLGLALAAHPIRIEAPIPGKSLVGIEVPNTARSTVGLLGLLSSSVFKESDKSLLFVLGRGISGKSIFADLAKMPHMLIAGATGSGKSVAIHAIVTSLLYRNAPENLRFIMIDPKRVELTLYNKIPHLLTPVITDAKKAILALKWAAKEMDRRYDILETESVRDISSYHKNIVEPAYEKALKQKDSEAELPEKMPYIVIVIDELADIMSMYPRELESAIVRLAQMSRAVGIHLIVSTQRPSVNVITGLIKANVPGRIALQVLSQIDSRTILDTGGAEKLLGAGDMLYLSGEMSQPRRLQSSFVSESEVKKVVSFLSKQNEGEPMNEINITDDTGRNSLFDSINGNTNEHDEDEDELYEEARETVIAADKASTSYLQRKLKIGYARAARLMDMLEERGVIGPADGARPREILEGAAQEGYGEDEKK